VFPRLTLFVVLMFALAASAQPPTPQTFQDPHGQYSVALPSGWAASFSGNDPVFRNGPCWVNVRVLTAPSASGAVDRAIAMFRSQFTTFSTINRGDTTIAGRPSHGLNIDATNPSGQRVSVLITAQPLGDHRYFVLVSSTPIDQAPVLNASVMSLAGSVHFSGE
jgi:hypothetical protein